MFSMSLFAGFRTSGPTRFISRPRASLGCGLFTRGLVTRRSPIGVPAQSGRIALNQPWVRCMSIVKSPYPSMDVPKMPLAQFIMKDFDKWPQNTALVDSVTKKAYTFEEVKKYARSVGSSLLKSGVKAGDVVCIHSQNCPEYAFAFLGVVGIGAVATLASPGHTSRELLYQLEDSKAKHIITTANLLETVQEATKNFTHLKNTFVIGGDHVPGCILFTDLLKDDGGEFPDDLAYDPEDTIALPYSSGTTGLPKGVMLSHSNIVSNMTGVTSDKKLLGMTPSDCLLGFLPFYHAYGLVLIMGAGILSGAKIVTIPKFEAEPFLRFIEQYKVTKLMIVPPVGILLANHPLVDKIDFSSVNDILSGAAPMAWETEKTIRKRTGLKIRQGFGMTELSPVGTLSPLSTDDGLKQGSVGPLVPMTEAKIRDIETDASLGPGQDGELCIRGSLVMKGYLNKPEATQNCMEKDGWLRTGDIAHYDEEGNFYIVDRLKELIKYKSSQVAPAELEELILSVTGVLDTAVVGKPCEDVGELPLAFVVKKPDAEITEEDIIKFIEERVAPTKRLRGGVIFVDEIPKSPSGKILRRVLRDRLKNVE
ncbi:uncharacterized protein LOC135484270 [Lineus longissimus]|uniref:uncharacterized protein LOC135484270 n=1 Tax=Lineus longissimus TaxID=88925 RepID=UPI002B4DDEB3